MDASTFDLLLISLAATIMVLFVIVVIKLLREDEPEEDSIPQAAPAPVPVPRTPIPPPRMAPPPEKSVPSPRPQAPSWPMVSLAIVETAEALHFWQVSQSSGVERSKMLVIAPEEPAVVTGSLGLAGATVWRLSRSDGDGLVNPADLEKIAYLIQNHLEKGSGRTVVLNGLQMLIDAVGVRNTHRFLDVSREIAEKTRGAVLVRLDPSLLEPMQCRQLEELATVIRM